MRRRNRSLHRPTREKYTPSRAEVWRVIAETSGWANTLLRILAATGARVSEAASIRWRDVDFDRKILRIPEKKRARKSDHREVFLPDVLATALVAVGVGDPMQRVLPVTIATARTSITQKVLKPICERLGVRYFTPHGIRRFVLDDLYEAGVDVGTVGKMLGQSPKIALVYYRQARHADMERAARLTALGEPAESNLINFEKRLKKDA